MTLTASDQAPPDYAGWLDTLSDEPRATHRVRLRIEVDVDVVLPPWLSAYQGLQAVGVVANRLDPDDILSRIDYAADPFLPAGARLHEIHGDVETLPS